jgi:pimeloyl-ACP methyl ester carboxylesterase
LPTQRTLKANGIDLHIAEEGEGPLVVLLHGWPESWYAWRHQFTPLAEAGYRVVAPDQRGYGDSDRPEGVDQYTIMHLVGDVVGLIEALGEREAVVVGHDWGAPVAWHTALLRPDLVRGVAGLSVPPSPRSQRPPLEIARKHFGEGFYQIYFQEPGVAEAEFGQDLTRTFRTVLGATPMGKPAPLIVEAGKGFLDRAEDPEALPDWLTDEDIAEFAAQYARSGFTGGLNWYRNIDRNWELTAPWQDAEITVPSLYVTGDRDPVRAFSSPRMIERLPELLTDLRGVHDLPGCGHWIQQERPDEVNAALLEFLKGL